MAKGKITVTAAQVDRLLADISAIPDRVVGNHLTDEEKTAYILGMIPDREEPRFALHIQTCESCGEDLERMFEAPRGEHLTFNEIYAYAGGNVPGNEKPRLDLHLATCKSCARSLESLREYEDYLRTHPGHLEAFRARLLGQKPADID